MNSQRALVLGLLFGCALLVGPGCNGDDAAEPGGVDDTPDASVPRLDAATDARAEARPDAASVLDATAEPDADAALDVDAAFVATADAWCPGYAERFCANETICGCDAAPGYPGTCLVSLEAQCRSSLESRYLAAARTGAIVFHPEAAQTCLDTFEPLFDACAQVPEDNFFVSCPIVQPAGGLGTLPGANEPCEANCAPGLRCGTDGVCRAPGPLGAPCGSIRECAFELACSANQCAAQDFADRGDSCTSGSDCSGESTACSASARKHCVARMAGQACQQDDDCIDGQQCDGNTCVASPGMDEECGHGVLCAVGLACGFEVRTCGPKPTAGQQCATGPGGSVCADGLACNNDVCGPVPGDGDPCAIGTPECGAGLGCSFEADGAVCRPLGAAGSACANSKTCASGTFCSSASSTCVTALAVGAPCSPSEDACGEGACLPDPSYVFRCAVRPGLGGECRIDECTEGLRCRTPFTAGTCVSRACGTLKF